MSDWSAPDGGSPSIPPVEPTPPVYPTPAAFAQPYPVPAPAGHKRGLGVLGTVVIAAVVAGVVGIVAGLAGYLIGSGIDSSTVASGDVAIAEAVNDVDTSGVQVESGVLSRGSGAVARIAEATLPAVVSIVVGTDEEGGSGSGFVIRPNGFIVTNNHVVSAVPGGDITVVLQDGTKLDAKVIGTNTNYDLAVVKVDKSGLPTLELGDSSAVAVGDDVVAIGAPLGLEGTVTSGIVSALDRPVTAGETEDDLSYINAIQTDAAINPGNSGGPLLDAAGRVIGVNSAIATMNAGEAGSIGLGFAIPANSVKRIADELIKTGKSTTPIMGVNLDMQFDGDGARVLEVNRNSPAESAKLRAGDVIIAVDDRPVADATELVVTIRDYAPGDTVVIGYERDGQRDEAKLILSDDSSTR